MGEIKAGGRAKSGQAKLGARKSAELRIISSRRCTWSDWLIKFRGCEKHEDWATHRRLASHGSGAVSTGEGGEAVERVSRRVGEERAGLWRGMSQYIECWEGRNNGEVCLLWEKRPKGDRWGEQIYRGSW